jgi:hypothetical protein
MATNNQKTDHLKVDPPVSIDVPKRSFNPVWAVVSFISPEDMIEKRFIHDANEFLYHDVNKQIMDTTVHVVSDINREFNNALEKKIAAYKSSNNEVYKAAADVLENVRKDLPMDEDDQVNKVLRTYKVDQQELDDRFQVYKMQNNKELEAEFNKQNGNATSVRGFKVRGCYEDLEPARARAKYCRDQIEEAIHAFVVPMGYWCPWDPNADAVQDQDYMLPELNDLMGKYKRNVEQRNEFYQKRKQMMIDEAGNSRNDQLKEKLRQRLAQRQHDRITGQLDQYNRSKNGGGAGQSASGGGKKKKNKNKRKNKKKGNNNGGNATTSTQGKQMTFEVPKQ